MNVLLLWVKYNYHQYLEENDLAQWVKVISSELFLGMYCKKQIFNAYQTHSMKASQKSLMSFIKIKIQNETISDSNKTTGNQAFH